MQSKAERFESYACECEKRADTAMDAQAKAVFRDMAIQWRELAGRLRSLRADAATVDDFFKTIAPGGG